MNVFFLSYRAIDYMNQWFTPSVWATDVGYYIVDNGQQTIPERLRAHVLHQTAQNIGCAGGMNLIAHLAFDEMGFDKIIMGQDDARFTQMMLDNIWVQMSSDTLVGAYDRSFEFALFGLHRDLYRAIGDFDENFIYGGCEDNDYKHRIKLAGKKVISLNYSADMNCSYSSKVEGNKLRLPGVYNATYIQLKWGRQYEYAHPFDNEFLSPFEEMPLQSGIKDVYGDIAEYPSKTELKIYKENNRGRNI